MSYIAAQKELKQLADPQKAKNLQRFFKTKKGEYGEGDVFLGLTAEQIKKIARECFEQIKLGDIQKLLKSGVHEERMLALRILILLFKKGNNAEKKEIYIFYLKNVKNVNNWDLVDISAPRIVGGYLMGSGERQILYKLARSGNLWEKRVAILSTLYFIKNGQYKDTLRLSTILLKDKHDLMHKAVGWMLREVGNKNMREEEVFLKKKYKKMPRTMLRYAIEKFPEKKRSAYLKGKI